MRSVACARADGGSPRLEVRRAAETTIALPCWWKAEESIPDDDHPAAKQKAGGWMRSVTNVPVAKRLGGRLGLRLQRKLFTAV